MESLVSLLKAVGPASVNSDVRAKILELIQSWATATEGRYDLAYIGEVYKTLQREGFQFPPRVSVASSMIDSSAVCSSAPCLSEFMSLTRYGPRSLRNGSTLTFA
jgi:growth factor-regulated tyrosine kinase substrate